ncbi:hypothetical protein Tco_1217188 [Tanacetum coccineum]
MPSFSLSNEDELDWYLLIEKIVEKKAPAKNIVAKPTAALKAKAVANPKAFAKAKPTAKAKTVAKPACF